MTSAYPGVDDKADPFFAPLDIAGYNYSPQRYESDHKRHPDRVMVATESFPDESYMYWSNVWNHSYVVGGVVASGLGDGVELLAGKGQLGVGWKAPRNIALQYITHALSVGDDEAQVRHRLARGPGQRFLHLLRQAGPVADPVMPFRDPDLRGSRVAIEFKFTGKAAVVLAVATGRGKQQEQQEE